MTTPEPGTGSAPTPPYQQPYQQPQYNQAQAYMPPPGYQQQPMAQFSGPGPRKSLNVVGLIALIAAVVGFIFACIPGALILGWILLPIGFVLSLVSLFLRDKGKWMGIVALIVSIVGTIVGFAVFFGVVASSFGNAFVNDAPTVVQPDQSGSVEQPAEEPGAAAGTRENPYPVGSTLEGEEWTVTVNSVAFGATDAVLAENQFNDVPPEGWEYILVNVTAVYTGADSDSGFSVGVNYVTPTGEQLTPYDLTAVPPDQFNVSAEVFTGGTIAGNIVIAVPSATAAQGVLAVELGILGGEPTFVAVQ